MARLEDWLADRSSPLADLVDHQRLAEMLTDQTVAQVGWRRSRALAKNLLEIDGWMRRYQVRIC